MAMLSPGEDVSHADFITAHGRDYHMFEQIDQEGRGNISLEQWMNWVTAKHAKKRAEKRGSGDAWIAGLLHALEVGCDKFELAHAQETPEEAAARDGPTEQMLNLARTIHERITAMSGTNGEGMSQEAFARAEAGKMNIFGEISTASRGIVDMATWIEYITTTHSRKRKARRGSMRTLPSEP